MKKIVVLFIMLILLAGFAHIAQGEIARATTGIIPVSGVLGSSNTAPHQPVQYLVDESPETVWETLPGSPAYAWAELSFSESCLIEGIRISGAVRGKLAVEYWQDGWHPFLGVQDITNPAGIIDLSYDRVAASRIRLWLANPGEEAKLGGIGEIEVLGRRLVLERLEPVAITTNHRTEKNCPAEYLFDQNTYTPWRLKAGNPEDGVIEAVLGEICSVKRIKLFGETAVASVKSDGRLKLQYQANGVWVDIPGIGPGMGNIGEYWRSFELEGAGIKTGKIRIILSGRKQTGGLRELEIWGTRSIIRGSRYMYTGSETVELDTSHSANFRFNCTVSKTALVNLHLVTTSLPSHAGALSLTWELNGKIQGVLTPVSSVNGFYLYRALV